MGKEKILPNESPIKKELHLDKKMNKSKLKVIEKERGITLVALVITMVIIIILSTVTINVVFSDNGIIRQATETKDRATNIIENEGSNMNSLLQEHANVLAEDSSIGKPYIDNVLPTAPELSDGMTPVKYVDGIGWVKTDASDADWYNYEEKKWANVVLGDSTFVTNGDKQVLNEDLAYSMLVWIPRYAYRITSQYHISTSSAGNIDIVFVDTTNTSKDGTQYSSEYPEIINEGEMSNYVVHPAFNFGGTELSGFWVGKFETSNTEGYGDSIDTANSLELTAQIKANVTSWRSLTIGNMFTVCTDLNREGNPYGLNTNNGVVDPHMMKNSEWGAVSYLSQNTTYGKGSEIWINNNSSFITGRAGESVSQSHNDAGAGTYTYDSENGQEASTTGNITGVYDMSGGAFECVAAYINNETSDLSINATSLLVANEKYKDVYNIGNSDTNSNNYALAIPENGYYGDAIYEISSNGTGATAWYGDYAGFPATRIPFFIRGGSYYDNTYGGVFYFYGDSAGTDVTTIATAEAFRVVIPVLNV